MDVGRSGGGAQRGPELDEATLNSFGRIGYELVAVTGRLLAYLKRGTLPESAKEELA
jgi:hypothetical protein